MPSAPAPVKPRAGETQRRGIVNVALGPDLRQALWLFCLEYGLSQGDFCKSAIERAMKVYRRREERRA